MTQKLTLALIALGLILASCSSPTPQPAEAESGKTVDLTTQVEKDANELKEITAELAKLNLLPNTTFIDEVQNNQLCSAYGRYLEYKKLLDRAGNRPSVTPASLFLNTASAGKHAALVGYEFILSSKPMSCGTSDKDTIRTYEMVEHVAGLITLYGETSDVKSIKQNVIRAAYIKAIKYMVEDIEENLDGEVKESARRWHVRREELASPTSTGESEMELLGLNN